MEDTEQLVIADILDRQSRGVAKYGTTVANNQLPLNMWIQHAYEEALDFAIYLKRVQQELNLQLARTLESSSGESHAQR